MEVAEEISRALANIWLRKYTEKFSSQTEQHLLIILFIVYFMGNRI